MDAITIDPADNVAIVLRDVKEGERIDLQERIITAMEDIPYTHKVALISIPKGSAIIKYGEKVAEASVNIEQGQWVHVHNLVSDNSSVN